jgi:CubicO group peptidase (beta-lactamase class C family)
VNHPISGQCDEAFGAVREAFAGNFAERGEVGAAVSVIVDGRAVVDLVGGWADPITQRPWQPDTIVNFYSVGKALIAMLVLQLVDEGQIGLDDPIASVWPEFGVGGKQRATVRHALCHRAGVPAIRQPLTNDDLWNWERMTAALAATYVQLERRSPAHVVLPSQWLLLAGDVHDDSHEFPGTNVDIPINVGLGYNFSKHWGVELQGIENLELRLADGASGREFDGSSHFS